MVERALQVIRFRDVFKRIDEQEEGQPAPEQPTESFARLPGPKETERTEVMRRPAESAEERTELAPRRRSRRAKKGISTEVSRALEEVLDSGDLIRPAEGRGEPPGTPPKEETPAASGEEGSDWEISLDEVLAKYPVDGPEDARTESLTADQVESLRGILSEDDETQERKRPSGRRKQARG